MTPYFTIITPSLQRLSLALCCESVDKQTYTNWQHIVMLDVPKVSKNMVTAIDDKRREIRQCTEVHNNYGNTCRHNGWKHAKGKWVLYLDDDNWLAHDDVLMNLRSVLEKTFSQWAIFPILRHGQVFFYDPPGCCYVDTANMVIRREVAQWPDRPEYTLDGIFCDELKAKYPYRAFPNFRPIVVMPQSSEGK